MVFIQIQRPILTDLLVQFDERLIDMKENCNEFNFSELDQYRDHVSQRVRTFDEQIHEFMEKERRIQDEFTKLLTDIELLNSFLLKPPEEFETCEMIFNEIDSIDNFVKLHQQIKQIQNELLTFHSTKLLPLNETIEEYTNHHLRDESTQLSTELMNISNRYRILTQDFSRLLERIDERIECETNNSIESYRKFIENLRVKLTRVRDDSRLTIDVKQRLINVSSIFPTKSSDLM